MTFADDAITTSTQASAAKVRALLQPETYDVPTTRVDLIETHFAWVFLTDDHVYKLKKPIALPGLDLSDADKRYRNCREELTLNRRLAPTVYLDVVTLTREEGRYRIDGKGQAVDSLVKMRRLPAGLMMDHVMATGEISTDSINAVARVLAQFHRDQPRFAFSREAYVQRIAMQIEANRTALKEVQLGLDPALVLAVAGAQEATLPLLDEQIGRRAAEGRIIECHGDLRPEHICLTMPPAIIDCLEFSLDLRILDPGEELAYLAVECRVAGSGHVGDAIFKAWRVLSGDSISDELFRFYASHRATTRAKIVAWHLNDPDFRGLRPWSRIAGEFLCTARASLSPLSDRPAS